MQRIGYPVHLIQESRVFGAGDYHWEKFNVKGIDPYHYDVKKVVAKYGVLPWVRMWWTKSLISPIDVVRLYRMTSRYRLLHLHVPAQIYLQFQGLRRKKIIISEAGWGRLLFDPHYHDYRSKNDSVAKLGRLAYSKADCIVMTNPDMYSFMLPHLNGKHGRKDVFIPFALNTERYKPAPTKKRKDELCFLSPSRWDFNIKGNDKFLVAFKCFIAAGYKARLKTADWGLSENARFAKEYLEKHGLTKLVEIVSPMAKPALAKAYNEADIIFDQFNIGSVGSLTPEAMSCAKPVFAYLNDWNLKCFGEWQPVLNVRTANDIYKAMVFATDPKVRETIGRRAREFVLKHHDQLVVAKKFRTLYEAILNGRKTNFQELLPINRCGEPIK